MDLSVLGQSECANEADLQVGRKRSGNDLAVLTVHPQRTNLVADSTDLLVSTNWQDGLGAFGGRSRPATGAGPRGNLGSV